MHALLQTDGVNRGSCPEPPRVPDHELLKPIAAGAYGEVWLARNIAGTLRAVKIVQRDRHSSEESFEREFNGLKRFEPVSRSHEGLVDILTIGLLPDGAGFYYVMELADGVGNPQSEVRDPKEARTTKSEPQSTPPNLRKSEFALPSELGFRSSDFYSPLTLRAHLKSRGALPADEVIALGVKLSEALGHLHSHGLVHRDVKPSNVLFIGGEPKLADAGLVAHVDDASSLVGTAGYIAPEGPGAPQADVYALGKVLYEASFGKDRLEFPALPVDVASRPDHARLLELNAILLRACATDRRDRYSGIQGMHHQLQLLSRGSSIRHPHLRGRYSRVEWKPIFAISLIALIGLMALVFPRKETFGDARSRIPGVNKLVADGYNCLLSSTPDRLKTGLTYFEEALQLDPDFVPAHFGAFGVYVAKGNLTGVRSSAANLVRLAADSTEAQIALSYQLWIDWRFAEAVETARKSVECRAYTRRAKARAHLGYGFQLLQTGKTEAALAQYQTAEKIAANLALSDPTIEHHLGHPYLAQRNFVEALKHYGRSVELEPRHSTGYYWKARTYEEMEEFEKAVEEYAEYLNRDRLGSDGAKVKQLVEDLREAARAGRESYWRKRLEQALNETKVDLYSIATLYARLGEKKNAYEYLEKACERRSFTQGMMFDLCWDHNDPHFRTIAKGIGIMP